jgi:hypothetical protein
MSFAINNVLLNTSIEQSLADVDKKLANFTYTPTWNYNLTSATQAGTMTVEPINGYKVVNVIDANGVDIVYWLSTLRALGLTKTASPTFLNNIYLTYVDVNNNFVVTGFGGINNNGNNTFTIGGGDVYTDGELFTKDNKIYASLITN